MGPGHGWEELDCFSLPGGGAFCFEAVLSICGKVSMCLAKVHPTGNSGQAACQALSPRGVLFFVHSLHSSLQ